MELTQTENVLLEDLILASKRETYWTTFYGGGDYQIFPSNWNSDAAFNDPDQDLASSSSSGLGLISPIELESDQYAFPHCEQISRLDGIAVPAEFDPCFDHCKQYRNLTPMTIGSGNAGMIQDVQVGLFGQGENGVCKVEEEQTVPPIMDESLSKMDLFGEQKSEVREVEKQPSKNLMAERRRRKRLNERLSMLRSIVPKVSKMDRTSILSSTIDYMKDLLDKIQKLHEESVKEKNTNLMNAMRNLTELKPDEVYAGSAPKFAVERRNLDTQIELCCASKPGLLMSTLSTLEALGLDIQQCVISCFSDFSVQATCSEVTEHRRILAPEDVKQALFRNAGYGGKCL
ncbi:OLC1v1010598C1 [Oldenlandia corymbosa var. corymbosa]|uniref:OLC1v1010598C1 n=1 Tax=Oldenlandia corymbosa var. corymbosa TaxID=529605 RepID=A0AAV1DUQ9_OLDCO|nr:OLC1v1010598C1 [Oldenlandia corymbosa var. corymbosa]